MDATSNASILNSVLAGSPKIANNNDNGTGLSTDQFLKIMAATMSNPSMDGGSSSGSSSNTDYLTQLAQFSQLDKLNQMGRNLQATVMMSQQQQAFNLMNKNVVVNTFDEKGNVTGNQSGVVSRVSFKDGYAQIQLNGTGKYHDLSALNEVAATGYATDLGTQKSK